VSESGPAPAGSDKGPSVQRAGNQTAWAALNGRILLQGEVPHVMAKDVVFALVFGSILVTILVVLNGNESTARVFTFMILLSTSACLVMYLVCCLALLRLQWPGRLGEARRGTAGLAVVGAFAGLYSLWAIAGAGREPAMRGVVMFATGVPVFWVMRRGCREQRFTATGRKQNNESREGVSSGLLTAEDSAVQHEIINLLRPQQAAPGWREGRAPNGSAALGNHAPQERGVRSSLRYRQVRRLGVQVRGILAVALSLVAVTRRAVLQEQQAPLRLRVGEARGPLVATDCREHWVPWCGRRRLPAAACPTHEHDQSEDCDEPSMLLPAGCLSGRHLPLAIRVHPGPGAWV